MQKGCVIKPKRKGKVIPKVYDNPHAIDFILNVTKSLSASQLWADSGCRKSVGGTDSHRTIQALYRKLGMKPEKVEKVNHFSFGNGAPATSTVTWMYPIFIGGSYKGDIAIAEVPGVCPILFSINMMIEWKIDLLNSEHMCSSPTMGISVPYKHDDRGYTPYIPMLEVSQDFNLADHVPPCFHIKPVAQ